MKTKRNLAILLTSVTCFLALPTVVFAAEPELFAQPAELMNSPLVYAAILAYLLMVLFWIVAIVTTVRYAQQKKQVCKEYRCLKNPLVKDMLGDSYDFRVIETPSELHRYHPQYLYDTFEMDELLESHEPQEHEKPQEPQEHQKPQGTQELQGFREPDEDLEPDEIETGLNATTIENRTVAASNLSSNYGYDPSAVTDSFDRIAMNLTLGMIQEVIERVQTPVAGEQDQDVGSVTADSGGSEETVTETPTPLIATEVYQGKHFRMSDTLETEHEPFIQAVPVMRHTRSSVEQLAQLARAVAQTIADDSSLGTQDEAAESSRKIG